MKGSQEHCIFTHHHRNIKRYCLPWISQERAAYRLSQNTETRSKETATVWEGFTLGAGSRRGEGGHGIGIFIMNLLVRFDF